MDHVTTPVLKNLGRRGTVLCILACLWFVVGCVVATTGKTIDPGNAILYEEFPIPLRVAMWTASGTLALVCALRTKGGGHGWTLLLFMPMERLVSHAWSLLMWIVPGEPAGMLARSLQMMAVWTLIIALLLLLAGWDEDSLEDA